MNIARITVNTGADAPILLTVYTTGSLALMRDMSREDRYAQYGAAEVNCGENNDAIDIAKRPS